MGRGLLVFAAAALMGGCASLPRAPADRAAEIVPCHAGGGPAPDASTRQFGTCLAWSDFLAQVDRPTASSPDGTHWSLPVMQRFLDRTGREDEATTPSVVLASSR